MRAYLQTVGLGLKPCQLRRHNLRLCPHLADGETVILLHPLSLQ